jgi:hypothetical protein
MGLLRQERAWYDNGAFAPLTGEEAMAYGVYTGKTGKTKSSCHKKKSAATKRAKSLRKQGKSARIRKLKSCG